MLSSSVFLFSPCTFEHKREPQTRVGLVTSSLPRKRSTTELLRLVSLITLTHFLSSVGRFAWPVRPVVSASFGAEDGARTRHL